MYTLNRNFHVPGCKDGRLPIFESENLDEIKKELQKQVFAGTPLLNLTITKEIPFEFKCAVKVTDDEETD